MLLVADANVLISGFLRDGLTRQLWLNTNINLFAPEFIINEFLEHSEEFFTRTGLDDHQNRLLLSKLLDELSIVKKEETLVYLKPARTLVTDPDDEEYFACALAVGADLWSHDRHLKNNRIRCWSTKELAQHFGYIKETT